MTASTDAAPSAVTTFGSGSSVGVHKLGAEPPLALLESLAELLRGYPEVEWAALCAIARGPAQPVPTVGLKIDSAFRQRVNEIVQRLREHGVHVSEAVQSIEPTVTNESEAALLGVPELAPALLFERLTTDAEGRQVEYVHSIYRGDRYRIVSKLTLGDQPRSTVDVQAKISNLNPF